VCMYVNLCSYKVFLIRIHLEENMGANGISSYVIAAYYQHSTLMSLSFITR
jgi:hypothetical protein